MDHGRDLEDQCLGITLLMFGRCWPSHSCLEIGSTSEILAWCNWGGVDLGDSMRSVISGA